jgi:hypothetical protein
MIKMLRVLVFISITVISVAGQPSASGGFREYVVQRFSTDTDKLRESSKSEINKICPVDDSVLARRVFSEYGAVFAATEKVTLPPTCIFADEAAVTAFRSKLQIQQLTIHGTNLLLQKDAADSLTQVLADAEMSGVTIAPLDGPIAGARTYYETLRIWNSRFEPALRFWSRRGMIASEDVAAIRSMKLDQQIERVIEWESKGYWFGTSRNRSIFSSTAPPGTSQHISLIALDVAPPLTAVKRSLLNARGWFQTVKGDPGHFTYLGVPESDLPKRGLKAILSEGITYWTPDLTDLQAPSP